MSKVTSRAVEQLRKALLVKNLAAGHGRMRAMLAALDLAALDRIQAMVDAKGYDWTEADLQAAIEG